MYKVKENFDHICRANGWKKTPQRLAVYSVVAGNTSHPCVEDIWHGALKLIPSISMDTVYRILGSFADGGIIRQMEISGVMRYDCCTDEHNHFICEKCGKIIDFERSELPLPHSVSELGEAKFIELVVNGICRDCLK